MEEFKATVLLIFGMWSMVVGLKGECPAWAKIVLPLVGGFALARFVDIVL